MLCSTSTFIILFVLSEKKSCRGLTVEIDSCDKVQFSFGVTLSKDNLALAGSAKLSKLSFSLMLAFVQWKMDQKYDYDSKSSNKVDIFVFNFTFILARFWRKYCLLWQIWHRFCDLPLKSNQQWCHISDFINTEIMI